MTREEAKKLIFSQWQSFLEDYIDYGGISEAYKMALKALEQYPCEDAISREAAIKAMNDLEQEDIEQFGCSIPEGFDGKRAIEALQSLPSVTPKQTDVLDKIRAEIKSKYDSIPRRNNDYDDGWVEALEWVYDDAVGKYMAESEE